MVASNALERAQVEVHASGRDAGEYHRGLALRTGGTFYYYWRNAGMLRF
jgi:hypothetical protein